MDTTPASAFPWWGVLIILAAGWGVYHLGTIPARRRQKILDAPLDPVVARCIRRCPLYQALDRPERLRFENTVRIFLDEQTIYGPRGTPIGMDLRAMVAAAAAWISHGIPDWRWPKQRDIVILPTQFGWDYELSASEGELAGMVHDQGPILLSEAALRAGFRDLRDGYNVAIHELAHVMDMAGGAPDGVPQGTSWSDTEAWEALMAARIEQLRRRPRDDHILPLDAAQDEAEFFAFCAEVFFEQPHALRTEDAELYAHLCRLFAIDPAARYDAASAAATLEAAPQTAAAPAPQAPVAAGEPHAP